MNELDLNPFIHIQSAKFQILPGEEDELVNDGTFGKSLLDRETTE